MRFRFHGRGGQGIKTAGRILGKAAFFEGLFAQDFAIYGAERRGAPITAFVRLSDAPILERGHIFNPSYVLVAAPSLLFDPTVKTLEGMVEGAVLFVNSSREIPILQPKKVHMIFRDVTGLALKYVGKDILSAAMGAVACKLSGTISLQSTVDSVGEELADLGLEPDMIEKNIQLAKECYLCVESVGLSGLSYKPSHKVVEVQYLGEKGIPDLLSVGNTAFRKTGSWRVFTPIIDRNLCTACGICYVYCPESCVSLDEQGYPAVDYDNCKGCLVCAIECPRKAIKTGRESAWS
ncbi:MAG: 2-oxoacid:acceptor oxidoreductase family protein [Aigarchaeota archaeon]|nr:2-oxoacid:acceptor oxidoreductase family protein [Aigarchaeota archaeon]